jgi:hypothetical protein
LSGIGFACGAVFSAGSKLGENGGAIPDPAYLIGYVIGSGIGVALLFAIVASIRNYFSK